MSMAEGSSAAPASQSGERIGTSRRACPGGIGRRAPPLAWLSATARSSSPRPASSAASIQPRAVSSGCSAKPDGGASRKARLARVSLRIAGLP